MTTTEEKINPKDYALVLEDTSISTWFERDRAHVALCLVMVDEPIAEWWDDDVASLVEDGFLDPKDWHQSAFDYAEHLGLINC